MPPLNQDNAVSLAILEVEVSHLKAGMAELKLTNAQQSAKLDSIINTMAEARGGWRTLLLIGGAAGTAGGFINWAIGHWKG